MQLALQFSPEKKTQDRERTDVRSTSSHRSEDSTDEAAEEQDKSFPPVEVGDWLIGLPFVLPRRNKLL